MSQAFISYSRADYAFAQRLAVELGDEGFTVWWDPELYGGQDFPNQIQRHLDAAEFVIVIWSDTAIASSWVISEAQRGLGQRKLVTCRVPAFKIANLPAPFSRLHCIKVTDTLEIFRALGSPQAVAKVERERDFEGWVWLILAFIAVATLMFGMIDRAGQ
jgi:hypothetical protein